MSTTTDRRPVLQPDEATARTAVESGGWIAVRLHRADTAGRLGLIEMEVPAGFGGLPLHVHPGFDETFRVLAGELTFRVGGDVVVVGPGGLVHVPGAVPHTFAELAGRPARVLLVASPGGHESYFEDLAVAARSGEPLGPGFYERLWWEHGITAVGSPDPRA
jgi:mannose-6-phosphate isomerase-like protein (cupin superfamily)